MAFRIVNELLILFVLCGLCWTKDCVKRDMCSCEMDDNSGSVDLTSLGNKDNTPRFKDVQCGADDWKYSYNPCGAFTEQSCDGVALCGVSPDGYQYMALGQADKVRFTYDGNSGNVIAGYLVMGTPIIATEIEMICDEHACQPEFVPIGRTSGQAAYKMQLKSICACAGKCSASGPDKCSASTSGAGAGGISVGSILLIGLLACVVFYLVIGVAYMKVRKSATGTELIPNKDLWKSFPGLVAGGFKFLFSKCTSR